MAAASQDTREFRRFLVSIAQQLSAQESHQLAYIHELPEQFHHQRALTVLHRLEVAGLYSCAKPERLVELMKDVNRIDLSKKAKEFVSKRGKRRKNAANLPESDEANDRRVTLRANYELEVALIQIKITLEQLDIVREALEEQQLVRCQELLSKAHDFAEAMRRKVQYASRLCHEAFDSIDQDDGSPKSVTGPSVSRERTHVEEKSRNSSNSSQAGSGVKPQPPAPPPKPQRVSSAAATGARETTPEMDDIYDKPSECATVPPAKDTGHHYYSYAELDAKGGGLQSQTRVLPSPMLPVDELKQLRAATLHCPSRSTQAVSGKLPHNESRQHSLPLPKHNTLPVTMTQSSGIPKPAPRPKRTQTARVAARQGSTPAFPVQHNDETDSSDYSGGTGTDDSGFSDPKAFLKQLPAHSRRSLPASHRQQSSSGSHYYKSLRRPDGVSDYYKSLSRDAIPELTRAQSQTQVIPVVSNPQSPSSGALAESESVAPKPILRKPLKPAIAQKPKNLSSRVYATRPGNTSEALHSNSQQGDHTLLGHSKDAYSGERADSKTRVDSEVYEQMDLAIPTPLPPRLRKIATLPRPPTPPHRGKLSITKALSTGDLRQVRKHVHFEDYRDEDLQNWRGDHRGAMSAKSGRPRYTKINHLMLDEAGEYCQPASWH